MFLAHKKCYFFDLLTPALGLRTELEVKISLALAAKVFYFSNTNFKLN